MVNKKKTIKQKIYSVNWYCNGFCYRTTTELDWEDVKRLRKVAKDIGDTMTYQLMRVETYKY